MHTGCPEDCWKGSIGLGPIGSHPDFYNSDHISPLRMHHLSLITQNKPPSPQYCPKSYPIHPYYQLASPPPQSLLAAVLQPYVAVLSQDLCSGCSQYLEYPSFRFQKQLTPLYNPFQATVQILPFPMDSPPQITLFKISTILSSFTLPIIPQHSSPPQK